MGNYRLIIFFKIRICCKITNLSSGVNEYSIDTCLIYLLDHIRSNYAEGLFSRMTMLDLQKAFDTIGHIILSYTLKIRSVEYIDWFKSYLSDRVQFVSRGNIMSKATNVSYLVVRFFL